LKECEKRIVQALENLGIILNKVENDPLNKNMNLERCAREISFAIARIYIGIGHFSPKAITFFLLVKWQSHFALPNNNKNGNFFRSN
jgi:hypothetical protein